ncbi:MAG: hypothetical protein MUC51_09510, partial [Anaerolineae bacterium]|nr:hypothetical protein [Anaerolineae bacterium]
MSTIRLENVSRVFTRASAEGRTVLANRRLAGQADRAFAERVTAQARDEAATHSAGGEVVALDNINLTIPDGQTFA